MTVTKEKIEHVLYTAECLFNSYGYHRTGVDMIMKESGVSKTTMYKHFKTKEDLVLEVLKRKSNVLIGSIKQKILISVQAKPNASVYQQINIVLDAIESWIKSSDFSGCLFMKAVSEYDGKDKEICNFAEKHKNRIKKIIKDILNNNPVRQTYNSDELAKNIALVIDGAIITAYIKGDKDIMKNARYIIEVIYKSYTRPDVC